MDKLWRVDEALEDSEGLRWIREWLGAYDLSKVDWITVRRGRSERYAFRGVCKFPSKRHGYRINCNVSKNAPYPITSLCAYLPCIATPTEHGRKCPKAMRLAIVTLPPATVRASNGNGCIVL